LELLGQINDREIFYTSFREDQNLFENLRNENWLAVPIGQDKDIHLYSRLADNCIDNNVSYICALGQSSELIHDIFDEEVVARKIAAGESVETQDDFKNSPMTTWHLNFSEGFWFALTSAYNDGKKIDTVVCIDLTSKGVKKHLKYLIDKIQTGWFPSEEKIEEPKFDN
jgi:hypothetical protein